MKKLFLGTTLVVGLALTLGLSACKQASTTNSISRESGQQTATSTQAPIEKQTTEYHVMVTVPNPPLKTQAETYTLQVHDLKANKPVETPPEVKVEMPMGNTPMIAPTTVSKGANPGEFLVTTEFTMAGNWTMQVKPVQSTETITLTLPVQ
jgi:hypothetical protein